jgi:hypothetical protein
MHSKNLIKLVELFLIIGILTFTIKAQTTLTDFEIMNFRQNKVKSFDLIQTTYLNNKLYKIDTIYNFQVFNSNGLIIEEKIKELVFVKKKYYYNNNNLLISEVALNIPQKKNNKALNPTKAPDCLFTDTFAISKYKYDEKDRLISVQKSDLMGINKGIVKYYYDNKNRLIYTIFTVAFETIIEFQLYKYCRFGIEYKIENNYDKTSGESFSYSDKGVLLRSVVTFDKMDRITYYNSNKLIEKIETKDCKDQLVNQWVYEYDKNNLLVCVEFNSVIGSKEKRINKFQYHYFE